MKNISLFNFELKSVAANPEFCNVNVFGIKSIWVPTVWTPETAPLLTLNILFESKVFRMSNFSVPIPILLPTDIRDGIFETYMSVTTPVVAELGISWYNNVLAVDIAMLKELLRPEADTVLNPLITTRSPLFKEGAVDINADISRPWSWTKTTFSKVSIVVSIEVISLPFNLLTETLKPPPSVPVLSKTADSPIR